MSYGDIERETSRHQRPADVDSYLARTCCRDHCPLHRKEIKSSCPVRGATRQLGAWRKPGNFHGRVRVTIPCDVATTTISARPINKPLQTTPGIFSSSASRIAGASIFENIRSRI